MLFTLFVEVLLQRLRSRFPDDRALAFADDIIQLLSEVDNEDFRDIYEMYEEFGRVSNLKVNVSKTFAIPAYKLGSGGAIREDDLHCLVEWPGMVDQVVASEEYLGIPIGLRITPKKMFEKPISKMDKAITSWGKIPMTLASRMVLANIFMGSLFSYVSQVCVMGKTVSKYVHSRMKGFCMKWHWINEEFFYAMPIILKFKLGSCVRHPRLWSLATFLRATNNLEIDQQIMGTLASLGIQLRDARAEFRRITGFPLDETEVPRGASVQTTYYRLLLEGSYNAKADDLFSSKISLFVDGHVETQRRLNNVSCTVPNHHIISFLRFIANGFPTKERRSLWGKKMQVPASVDRTAVSSEVDLGAPVVFTSTDGESWASVSEDTNWSQVTWIKASGNQGDMRCRICKMDQANLCMSK